MSTKKQVKKEVKRDLRKIGRTRPKGGDEVGKFLKLSQTNARQAALASLDPESAIERGYLPGCCDGTFNNTVRWYSRTKQAFSTRAMNTEFGAQLMVGPSLNDQITEATAWNPTYQPTASATTDDSSYASALTSVTLVRCVAMVAEIRCLDETLNLNGSRTIVQGDRSLWGVDNDYIFSKKEAITIGNNKPGEVTRMPWLNPESSEFNAVTLSPFTAAPNPLLDLPYIHILLFADGANIPFEIQVVSIWEALPDVNCLAPVFPYIGDPTVYAASLQAALAKVPLNSHERISYEDDGVIASIASDVQTIVGGAQKALQMFEDARGTANQAIDFFDGMGAKIGGFFNGLFSEEKRDPTPSEQQLIAAYLSLTMGRVGPSVALNFLSEKFRTMTPEQVAQWVSSELGLTRPERGGAGLVKPDDSMVLVGTSKKAPAVLTRR